MCTLISVLCEYGVLEGQQNTIQTCILSYLYCASTVYQRGNRIQYKHVQSHICTVQLQCTRGAIEYNTNMCTLISVLCEYSVLEGQQSPIHTCVLSYLYCASAVYQNTIEYNTNMCTLVTVLCESSTPQLHNTDMRVHMFVLYSIAPLVQHTDTVQIREYTCLYCILLPLQYTVLTQYRYESTHVCIGLYCPLVHHTCTVQIREYTCLYWTLLPLRCTRGAIEYNTNMCTLVSVLCQYVVLEGQQNTIQTCVLSYLYCATTVYQRGNRVQYKHVYSLICTVQVWCTRGQQSPIQTCVLSYLYYVSTVYQRGNRIQYKHVYSCICTVQVQCTRGSIECNTNMCTLISVLCKYSLLEGQQNTIQTYVLSYLYCASTVYWRGNRIQYKHVYSRICTVQVQCTRGAIEYNTNMCTLISVLCKYSVLEGQQNTI